MTAVSDERGTVELRELAEQAGRGRADPARSACDQRAAAGQGERKVRRRVRRVHK